MYVGVCVCLFVCLLFVSVHVLRCVYSYIIRSLCVCVCVCVCFCVIGCPLV